MADMNLSVDDIIAFSASEVVVAPTTGTTQATELVWDSRLAGPASLFVAVKGERADGNDYIIEALRLGAVAAIASKKPSADVMAVATQTGAALLHAPDDDIFAALQSLAAAYRQKLPATVVGITGSSGKTTTKDLIAGVLAAGFNTHATPGNRNNEIGLPATILDADPKHEMIVAEMGMQALGEIAALCRVALPKIGVITNVGVAHCELLGSRENIARAKSELFASLPDTTGIAILNGDDPYSQRLRELARLDERTVTVVSYGLGANNDLRATGISYDAGGHPSFVLWLPDGREYPARVGLPGEHNVYNALAAVAVGIAAGVPVPKILAALTEAKPAALRQEIIRTRFGAIINDTYNANPDSMRAALQLLGQFSARGRHIAVLGDMYELGSEEQAFHREIGAFAFVSGVDILVTVGELGASIAEGALAVGMPAERVFSCANSATAVEVLTSLLCEGQSVYTSEKDSSDSTSANDPANDPANDSATANDFASATASNNAAPVKDVVLVKASRGMQLEKLVAKLEQIGSKV
ncbi:MAG: UDP-N-acetylmuramoyl-tripeptide--D-alanyl-D-alanine ligase [Coriobacteriales bacterium]|jgi:UDP-N-acetylmuramoyl-tripeptide--D-alanyl-D-alanine ligase|nr:UDP-N-acetylmuramoyl-tripeptide--D-alanyl-D-alanine ligase [Coriobacteriales bacterium]